MIVSETSLFPSGHSPSIEKAKPEEGIPIGDFPFLIAKTLVNCYTWLTSVPTEKRRDYILFKPAPEPFRKLCAFGYVEGVPEGGQTWKDLNRLLENAHAKFTADPFHGKMYASVLERFNESPWYERERKLKIWNLRCKSFDTREGRGDETKEFV